MQLEIISKLLISNAVKIVNMKYYNCYVILKFLSLNSDFIDIRIPENFHSKN